MFIMKKLLTLWVLLLVLSCRKVPIQPDPPVVQNTSTSLRQAKQANSSTEILVKFKNQTPDAAALQGIGGVQKKRVWTKAMQRQNDHGFWVIQVPNVSQALEALENNPNVEWVSENSKVEAIWTTPNDPYLPQLWGMSNIKVAPVWSAGNKGNQDIFVGVIDAGIYLNHPDLCGQIWTNPHEPIDGIDNDGNGYIDDVNGWDFYNNDRSITDPNDNHGTHVSGTIGGLGNNGIGVIGVAPQVTIIGVKFLDGFYGGYTSDAIEAIDYLTDLKIRHNLNIVASNNSWGGGGYSQGLYDAIERSKSAGILFVAAAGNNSSNNDSSPFYPANYGNQNVISVAATTSTDLMASFSNYGATQVDLGAPGASVISTTLGWPSTFNYSSYSGTSMAAPHVTGAIVLYKNAHPTASWSQIKTGILNSTRSIPALQGKTVTGGTLDVSTFTGVTSPIQGSRSCTVIDPTPPAKVTGLYSSNITNTSFRLDWAVPYDNSGVFNYRVYRKISTSTTWNYDLIATPAWVLSNLIPATTYEIYIVAYDYSGNASEPSDILQVTTLNDATPPTTPVLSFVSGTSSSLSFSWTASTDNSGIGGYDFYLKPTASSNYTKYTLANVLNTTIYGLQAATSYEGYVVARDVAGNLSGNSNSVTGTTQPPPISISANLTLGGTNTSHILSWNITTNGTIGSVVIELKSGTGNSQFTPIYTAPNNPFGTYTNIVTKKGKYTYRVITRTTTGITATSNTVTVNVNGK
jgi:subtilisin family serine protease